MPRRLMILAFMLTGLLESRASSPERDWPQWQGHDRNAISQETGLLQEWPTEGPPLAWRIDNLGGGDSAPAIAEGRLFGMSAKDGQEVVWALSEANGETIWMTPLGQTLIVTAGCGWAQRWGGPVEEIHPGDVIWFPPGEKHWHGATAATALTHIAIQEKLDGKAVDWLEHVSDEQYGVGSTLPSP